MECCSYKAVVPSDYEKCWKIQAVLERLIEAGQFQRRQKSILLMSIGEAISNAIKHGNRHDPTKFITIQCGISPEDLVLVVEDEGEGFDPDKVPDPTTPDNIEQVNGRGVLLMRELMSEMSYNDRGNRLTLRLVR
jgi:serine/threonine-protein kinase RsbW